MEEMDLENHLDDKEFELVQVPHDHIKSEKEEVSGIQKENIKVENDFDINESEVIRFTHVFIKDEYGQYLNTGLDTDAVSDRSKNAPDKIANFDYELTIKNENDVQRVLKEDTKIVLNSTATEHDLTEPHVKCETVEELKLENGLDIDPCEITEITEEHLIKNEDDHISEQPREEHSNKFNICIYCNMTFRRKRSLDDHIIKKHPGFITELSSKIHACAQCKFKTTKKENLVQHVLKHPRAESDDKPKKCVHCNGTFTRRVTLNNHIIKKHPAYVASISSKIHECKYCVFKTTIKGHLVSHMMGKHPGAEVVYDLETCIHCNATFQYKRKLDDHIIKKHPQCIASVSNNIHECEHCGFKTAIKSYLVSHMRKHLGKEVGCELETCIHCNSTFKYKKSLDNHIIKKHPEYIASVSSKIHECKYCEFRTAFQSCLVRHVGVHSGSEVGCELETCIHCQSKFKDKRKLDDHIIKEHPQYSASVSSKIHECSYCTYKTTNKGSFNRHVLKHLDAERIDKLSIFTAGAIHK